MAHLLLKVPRTSIKPHMGQKERQAAKSNKRRFFRQKRIKRKQRLARLTMLSKNSHGLGSFFGLSSAMA
jgi:hypothetical protein